jgi:hypothetical protein
VHIRLLEQSRFFVKRLEARFDDLVDDVSRLSLLGEFLGQDIFLTRHDCGIERRRIESLRIGRGNMHGKQTAEGNQLVRLPG